MVTPKTKTVSQVKREQHKVQDAPISNIFLLYMKWTTNRITRDVYRHSNIVYNIPNNKIYSQELEYNVKEPT